MLQIAYNIIINCGMWFSLALSLQISHANKIPCAKYHLFNLARIVCLIFCCFFILFSVCYYIFYVRFESFYGWFIGDIKMNIILHISRYTRLCSGHCSSFSKYICIFFFCPFGVTNNQVST